MGHSITKANISDLERITEMHTKYIEDSFFSVLGNKILKIIYSELILSKYAGTYVYSVDGEITGYISVFFNKKMIFLKILLTNFPLIIFSVKLKFLLRSVLYFAGCVKYILKKQYCKSEFAFIAVDEHYRNAKTASKLIDFAENIMKEKNIYKIQLSVNDDNVPSQNLVENKKYIFYKKIYFYGKNMRMYYKLL